MDTLTDNLDRYQYMAFRWMLFIIFVVCAIEMLEKHLHLKSHVKHLLSWITQQFKS